MAEELTTVQRVEPRWHPAVIAVMASLATLAIVAVFCFWMIASQSASSLPFLSLAPGGDPAPKLASDGDGALGGVIEGVFGTIQFAIAVLSGLVLVISVGVTYFMGRNAREAQRSAREELQEIASLYRDNISETKNSIQTTIELGVRDFLRLGENQKMLEDYRLLHEETAKTYSEIMVVIGKLEFNTPTVEFISKDYEGSFLQLSDEEGKYLAEEKSAADNYWSFPERRALLQQALIKAEDGALLRAISANTAFNAAQTAARAGLNTMSHRLATLAAWLDDRPLNRLRMFRSEFERCDRYIVEKDKDGRFALVNKNPDNDPIEAKKIRENAFDQIVAAIPDFPSFNSHLLYSEVWNIFVHSGNLSRYISTMETALADAEKAGRYLPSHANASIARAWAITGEPGWRDACIAQIRMAKAKLANESPGASWVRDTLRDIDHAMRAAKLDPTEVFGEPDANETDDNSTPQ